MLKDIKIGSFTLGQNHKPFIIAEMSGNHNQSLERALEIVDAAAASGAHAIKLQTYTPDTITLNSQKEDFMIRDPKSLWNGRNLYELYQEAYTPWEWHKPIMDRCKKHGIECFSTPFDDTAVDFLEELGVNCYKIASFENTFIPLLKKIARLKKPIIMSTGLASLADLELSVNTIRQAGCEDLILLKCTSTYPATPENTNVSTIPHMRELFNCQVGLSDHTMGCGTSLAAVSLGAVAIEKHFTLRRADGGVDSAFSMEPSELKMLVKESENAFLSLGKVTYGPTPAEEKSKIFRRSVYISADMKRGDVFTEKNIRCVRPSYGIETKYYDDILGKRVNRDLTFGTAMRLEYLLVEE